MKEIHKYILKLGAFVGLLGFVGVKCNIDSQEYSTPNGFRGPGYEVLLENDKLKVRTFHSWALHSGYQSSSALWGIEEVIKRCGPLTLEKYSTNKPFIGNNETGFEMSFSGNNLDRCIHKLEE